MSSLGLIILNGRCIHDKPGEFTFINANGQSVIDLAAASIDCLHLVRDFNVVGQPGSEHLPIEVNFEFEVGTPAAVGEVSNVMTPLPKLRWSEGDSRFYRDRISSAITRTTLSPNAQDNVHIISQCILDSAHSKPTTVSTINQLGKQRWFDRECSVARKKVFRLLSKFRKSGANEAKAEYLLEQRAYKRLCSIKNAHFIH